MISSKNGFSLIELLVSIAVVGVLAGVVVVGVDPALKIADTKRKITNTSARQMLDIITYSRVANSKVMKDITGSGCTSCSVWPNWDCYCKDLSNTIDPSVASCLNAHNISWAKIEPGTPIPADGWGTILMFDENELEAGNCNKDVLFSAGPDKKLRRGSTCPELPADDISYQVPFYSCP